MAFNLLIVEDEPLVAKRLVRLSGELMGDKIASSRLVTDVRAAQTILVDEPIDLILLDLNLTGKDGFDLLRQFTAKAAHTIVVSAETDRAIEAFDLGVLDFVAKPFTRARLEKALVRFDPPASGDEQHTGGIIPPPCAKHVAFEVGPRVETVDVNDIIYFKGADKYSEATLKNGSTKFHSKPLSRLETILSGKFIRSHKSFLVHIEAIRALRSREGSRYEIDLADGHSLPIGRTRVDHVRRLLAARETVPA